MTSRRFPSLLAGLSAVAAAAAVGITAPASAVTPTTLYVNPQGTGNACNKVDPCGIGTAFFNAASGDHVVLDAGTYARGNVSLALNHTGVTVSSASASSPATITSDATTGVEITSGSSLTGAVITYTGAAGNYALAVDATGSASHVSVTSSMGNACEVFGTLTDSLCVTTAANSVAVGGDQSLSTVSPALRGVTAVATASTSTAIDYQAAGNETISASATNVIAAGGAAGVVAAAGTSSSATVTLNHSDFARTVATTQSGGTAAVNSGAGNISAKPTFVDAAKGDYQEAAGSATINAGVADPKTDLTDLAGRPRVIGSHVDMGAYEYAPAPTLTKLTVKPKTTTVKLAVTADPNGRATKVIFTIRGGKKPIHSATLKPGAGATAVKLTTLVKGLTAKTTYTVFATAKNSAGKQKTKTLKFTTA